MNQWINPRTCQLTTGNGRLLNPKSKVNREKESLGQASLDRLARHAANVDPMAALRYE